MASQTVMRALACAVVCLAPVLSERLIEEDLLEEMTSKSRRDEDLGTTLKAKCNGGMARTCRFSLSGSFGAGGFGRELLDLRVPENDIERLISRLNAIGSESLEASNLKGKQIARDFSDELHDKGKLLASGGFTSHEIYFFSDVYRDGEFLAWDHFVTLKKHSENDVPPFFEFTENYDRFCCCKKSSKSSCKDSSNYNEDQGTCCKFKYSKAANGCENTGILGTKSKIDAEDRDCVGRHPARDAPPPPSWA